MVQTILIPIGMSDSVSSDVHYAFSIAKRFNAKLSLLQTYMPHHHVSYPVAEFSGGVNATMVEPINLEELKQNTEEQIRIEIPEIRFANYELLTLPGPASDIIVEQSEELHPDLMIINDGSESDMGIIFESIPEKISRKSYCPTLVVPDNYSYQPIKTISLAIDEESIYEQIPFDDLVIWLNEYDASLDIIHVHDNTEKEASEEVQKAIYSTLKEKIDENNIVKYSFRTVLAEDTEDGISNFVDRHDVDLLALIHRDHGFFQRLFDPGLRKQLIGTSKVPLLILK